MSDLPICEFLILEIIGTRLNITFNRPDQRNAINMKMGAEFASVVDWLETNEGIRLVILKGSGGHFCAGGDIKERKNQTEVMVKDDEDPIVTRNQNAGLAFLKFERLPQTTVAVVEGSAFGGGMGYACLTDITILSKTARMGMPETTLGVAPAQISPYVVKRIGLTRARQLALTAERFDGEKAYEYGIGQYLCDPGDLEETTEKIVAQIMRCGPKANAATKKIMLNIESQAPEDIPAFCAEIFADLNRSDEGKEGQRAFTEKRKPRWEMG